MDILKSKNSSAVQAHINMLQGVINRMANNSANCKTWAITILSAILVLYADDKIAKSELWICYIPMCLFFFLDCYYLGLEQQMIKRQSSCVEKINNGEDVAKEIFTIKRQGQNLQLKYILFQMIKTFFCQFMITMKAVFSFSILPFYGFVLGFIYCLGR